MRDDMTMEEIAAAAQAVDPYGVSEAFKQRLIDEKGQWWARKVVTLSGMKSCIGILAKTDGVAAEVVKVSLTRLVAADMLLDLKEKFPDRDTDDMVEEITNDAAELLKLVRELAGETMDRMETKH